MKQESLKMELSGKELEGITGGTIKEFGQGFVALFIMGPLLTAGEEINSLKLSVPQRAGMATGCVSFIAAVIGIERACCWAYKKLKKD